MKRSLRAIFNQTRVVVKNNSYQGSKVLKKGHSFLSVLSITLMVFITLSVTPLKMFSQGCGFTASCSFTTTPFVGPTNVGCFGDSTGALDLVFYSGGSSYPFCFEWREGSETGAILSSGTVASAGASPVPAGSGKISNLPAGNYILITFNSATTRCKHVSPQSVSGPSSVFTASINSTSPPSCAGVCQNTVTTTGSGGTPPYDFIWSTTATENDVTSSAVSNLCASTYSVTITDDAGCTLLLNTTITASPNPTINAGVDKLLCNGQSGVAIGGSPTASSGTTPYTYDWSNSGSLSSGTAANPTASPTSTTTYTVTVTDKNGCTGSDAAIVTVNPAINLALTKTDVVCAGTNDGTVSVQTLTGGTSPYTYLWSAGSPTTNPSINTLGAGVYTLTVTDAKLCTTTSSQTVDAPSSLVATASSVDITCNGANNGSATASPVGGRTPYTYKWSSGPTTQTINSLSGGAYTVTVTDASACTSVETVTVTDPPAFSTSFSKVDPTCNGSTDGSASTSPSGGTSPYSIVWKKGVTQVGTSSTLTGQSAGSYSLNITDGGGCLVTQSFTLDEPAAILPTLTSSNVTCSGANNGSITSSPTGGNSSTYSFSWSNSSTSSGTNSSISSLNAGAYTVTVTDSKSCTGTASKTITTPSAIVPNVTVINATCTGTCNGSASAAPTGGNSFIGFYFYNWSIGGSTNSSISNLCAGTYTVTVTDFSACTAVQTIDVIVPNALTVVKSSTAPSCNGKFDGTASVAVSNGTPNYGYLWSTGATTSSVTGLGAGVTTCTITDANSCTNVSTFTLTPPASLSISSSLINSNCGTLCDGSATLTVGGGTTPYTYNWPVTAGSQTTLMATSLCAGTYTVTVTDKNGCLDTEDVTVLDLVQISVDTTVVTKDCNDMFCDGSAIATASGGTAPYAFSWSDGFVIPIDSLNSSADSLCVGTVTVTATDASGCKRVQTITIPAAPDVLIVVDSVVNVTCKGNDDGEIYALGAGGTGTLSYLWNTGATTTSLTGLSPGTYSITITDENNCRVDTTGVVIEPSVLSATASKVDLNCNSDCKGSATANPVGGTAPYTYLWSANALAQTTKTATLLCAGTYTVSITDKNGCFTTATTTLDQPTTLAGTSSQTHITCKGANDGKSTVTPSGGTTPYTYTWDINAGFQTTQTATSLSQGTKNVTVTDAKTCSIVLSPVINEPTLLTVSNSKTNILCNGASTGQITAVPGGGTTPYTYIWSGSASSQTTISANGLIADTYTVTVTDAKGCTATSSATLDEPTALSVVVTKSDGLCSGSTSGSATATPAGGFGSYVYNWGATANNQTTATATNLSAGTYTVTVTDDNTCKTTGSITINTPTALTGTPNPTSSNCKVADGVAWVNPLSGGTPPYSHSWSNGSTSEIINNLAAGVYTDTITDDNGCVVIIEVPVSNIDGPSAATIITNNVTCFNGCNGNATVTGVTGGTSPYTYKWDDASTQTTTTATNLCADTLILEITDDSSCVYYTPYIVITQPSQIAPNFASANATCTGISDGTIAANPSGGTLPYSYNWTNGNTTSAISLLSSGTYRLTITDKNGCTLVDSSTVSDAVALSVTLNANNLSCNSLCNGTATATSLGGLPPYTYLWDDSDQQATSTATGLCADDYNVTITDKNGCSIDTVVTITEPTALSVAATVTDATCGNSDGDIVLTPSGGDGFYSYEWLNPSDSTSNSVSGLSAGVKMCVVSDGANCSDTISVAVANINGPLLNSSSVNVLCSGGATGSASVSVLSGNSPYTYNWIPGGNTTTTISNLSAGTYYILVTDAINCIAIDTVVVSQATTISTAFVSNPVSCNGGSDGSITTIPSQGVVPYTYKWSNLATTQTISGLSATTYSVTVSDANSCSSVSSVLLSEPTVLSISTTATDITCYGLNNGIANAIPSGGTPPYSYVWSNGETAALVSTLSAGNYTVTVIDAAGCTITSPLTINEPFEITATGGIVAPTTCGNCNGEISIAGAGGNGSYTYLWSSGALTTTTVSNLCAGSYDVTITDANVCTSVINYIINNSDGPQVTTEGDTVSCFNDCSGTATTSISGGNSPYTYIWSDPAFQTADNALNLCDGVYQVVVSDNNSCAGIATVIIAEPTQLINSLSYTDVSCTALCDITATATVTGGISPYDYLWSDGQTTSIAAGLCAGTMYVTITDANLCSRIDSIIISETAPLNLSLSVINPNCGTVCDGLIQPTVSGGTKPYSYLWSNSSTSSLLSGLCAGTFTLTATDALGCSKTQSEVIAPPSALTLSTSSTSVICNGGKSGTATATAGGGALPYKYNWSPNGKTTATITDLIAGNYTVTVTDNNGCTITGSESVNQPNSLILDSITSVNPSCGDTNGVISVYPSGGSLPYSYAWNDFYSQTTQDADSLFSGSYEVTITYNGVCSTTFSGVPLSNSNGPDVALTTVDVFCNGNCNGSITATATNGTSPYTYKWDDPSNQTTLKASNLCTGIYNVTVTDAAGCITFSSDTVETPEILDASLTLTNTSCGSFSDGTAKITGSGGTLPYSFLWNTGLTNDSIGGLATGEYCVTLTDFNGCSANVCDTVYEPETIALTLTSTNVICNSDSTGTATVSPSGGLGNFTYAWSTTPTQINATATNLFAGNFTVTVTDSTGCSKTASISIDEPTAISTLLDAVEPACDSANGSITAVPSGGSGNNYTYLWSNGDTNDTADSLASGLINLTVTDTSGCQFMFNYLLGNSNGPVITVDNITNIDCNGDATGAISVTATGTSPFTYLWSNAENSDDITGLPAGSYTLVVEDASGCTQSFDTIVTQSSLINVTINTTPSTCGDNNGTASAKSISGGNGSYSYLWNTGSTSDSISILSSGSVNLTVTDGLGCSVLASNTINSFGGTDSVQFVETNASCFGLCDGSINVTPYGGQSPFSYSWSSSSQTTANVTGLCAGNYTVTITDANKCSYVGTAKIAEPTKFSFDAILKSEPSCTASDGSIAVSVSGGTGTLLYKWNDGQTTSTASNLGAGTYTITVSDDLVCDTIINISLNNSNGPSVTTTPTEILCSGNCDGIITTTTTGGTSPYNYAWSGSASSQTTLAATDLCAGTYTVTVTDDATCITIVTDSITKSSVLSASLTKTDLSCSGNTNGTATVTPTGGVSPYSVKWSNLSSNTTISSLTAGIYTVTISDNGSCSIIDSITIQSPSSFDLVSITGVDIECNSTCNGQATVNVTGGTQPYSYLWNNTQTGATITSLCVGSYSVTATDLSGCTVESTIEIKEPKSLMIDSIIKVSPDCNDSNGQIAIYISGGTGNYSYLWTGGSSTSTVTGLAANSYHVNVTDDAGCDVSTTIDLSNSNAPNVTTSVTDIFCNGSCNGIISTSLNGGTAPYTYKWNDSKAQTDSIADSLCVGIYTLTVTDNASCIAIISDTVTESSALLAVMNKTDIICSGNANGTATINVSGGQPPYSYIWSNASTSSSLSGLTAGTYTVTVSDGFGFPGCSLIDSVTIISPTPLVVNSLTGKNTSCFDVCDGESTLSVSGGTTPYKYVWNDALFQKTTTATGLCAGTYNVTITDKSSCVIDTLIIITEPQAITLSSNVTNPKCDSLNGKITITVGGGNGLPYNYKWSSGVDPLSTTIAANLAAGMYTVTITDAALCSQSFGIPLNNASGPDIKLDSLNNLICANDAVGLIEVTVTGISPLSYNWLSGQTTEDIYDLSAGQYILEVKDSGGCITLLDTLITQPNPLLVDYASIGTLCDSCDGAVDLIVIGGTGSYTYNWDFNAQLNSNSINNVCAGIYEGEVLDQNKCTVEFISTVDNIGGPDSIVVSTNNVKCFAGSDGSATVEVFGGVAPYSYNWTTGVASDTTAFVTNLENGIYFVSVKDANRCVKTENITISQPTKIEIDFTRVHPNCGFFDGSVSASPSGGTPPYSYLWANMLETTSSISNLTVGIYATTITDANGCEVPDSTTLSNPTGPKVTLDSIRNVSCFGLSDGYLSISATSIDTPLAYIWIPNRDTATTISNLAAGEYIISVTDKNNCSTLETYEIVHPDTLTLTIPDVVNVSCFGLCNGSLSVNAKGGVPPYNYIWSTTPTQTNVTATNLCIGSYVVTVTDDNKCMVSNPAKIEQPDTLNVSIDSVDDPFCSNSQDGVIAITTTGGTAAYSYQWTGPDNFSSLLEDLTGINSGKYSLTVTDFNGCKYTRDTLVDADVIVKIDSLTNDFKICNNLPVELTGYATGSSIAYTWSKETASNIIGTTQKIELLPGVGVYQFILQIVSNGCTDSDTVKVTVEEIPIAEAGSTSPIIDGLCRTIGGNPTGPFDATYLWEPAVSINSVSLANPSVCPDISLTYHVTVTSSNGCSSTDSIKVEVLPEISFNSGFSPNGDGIGDAWMINNITDFPDVVVEVYNRWGQLVYKSTPGYKDPWEGDFRGENLPIGTYYYIINLNHPEFTKPLTGPITIVR